MANTTEVVDLGCYSSRSYERVNKEKEEQANHRRATRRRVAIIVISFILLIGIVVATTVMLMMNRKATRNGDDDGNSSPSAAGRSSDIVAVVCSVTSHPRSCYESIQSMVGEIGVKDPKEIFKLSLDVANKELSRVLTVSRLLFMEANDTRVRGAIKVCRILIEQSADGIKESHDLGLGPSSVDDIVTWLSAALTNLDTCMDGFEGTSRIFRVTIREVVAKATEYVSNGLAIAVKVVKNLKEMRRKMEEVEVGEEEVGVVDVVVAKDGTGQFGTIGEAVEAAPERRKKAFVIHVKEGRYVEKVRVGMEKWNIVMVGDGAEKTVVTAASSFADGITTFDTAIFAVEGRGFMARDMGFENTADPKKGSAVVVRSSSDRSIFYRCSFFGYENTLYALSFRQFYRDCEIHGTRDFILGNAAVVLQNCTLRPRRPLRGQTNTMLSQGRSYPYQNTATSLQDCRISSHENSKATTFLGRSWKPYARMVIMKSRIESVVDPKGWRLDRNNKPPPTVFFGEYQNLGPGSSVEDRVKWDGYKPKLSKKEARRFLVGPLIDGKNWIPRRGVNYSDAL